MEGVRKIDQISTATGLLWIFGGIIIVHLLLFVASMGIWGYKNYKRIALFSYIVEIAITIFIIYVNVSNIVLWFPWKEERVFVCQIGSILMVVTSIVMLSSIVLYRKYKTISNILVNLASLLGVILFWGVIRAINI